MSDTELVRAAIELVRVRHSKWGRPPTFLWQRVGGLFGFKGEVWQREICVRHGFNPDERYKP